MTTNYFSQKIQSILRDNMSNRYIGGQESGKLSRRGLYRVPAGSVKVFEKRLERKGKHYNILLVLDVSGSMQSDNRIVTASLCMAQLIVALDKSDVNFAVMTFNRDVIIQKDFSRKIATKKVSVIQGSLQELVYARPSNDENHDYIAAKQALKMMAGQTEGKNITFFIVDGVWPACMCGAETTLVQRDAQKYKMPYATPQELYINTMNKLQKFSEVYSIGMYNDVSHMYPEHIVIYSEEEFVDAFLKRLVKLVKR